MHVIFASEFPHLQGVYHVYSIYWTWACYMNIMPRCLGSFYEYRKAVERICVPEAFQSSMNRINLVEAEILPWKPHYVATTNISYINTPVGGWNWMGLSVSIWTRQNLIVRYKMTYLLEPPLYWIMFIQLNFHVHEKWWSDYLWWTDVGADILDLTGQNTETFGHLSEEDTYFELSPEQQSSFNMLQRVNSYLRKEYHALYDTLWSSNFKSPSTSLPRRYTYQLASLQQFIAVRLLLSRILYVCISLALVNSSFRMAVQKGGVLFSRNLRSSLGFEKSLPQVF